MSMDVHILATYFMKKQLNDAIYVSNIIDEKLTTWENMFIVCLIEVK
jgi:hypothetical protein